MTQSKTRKPASSGRRAAKAKKATTTSIAVRPSVRDRLAKIERRYGLDHSEALSLVLKVFETTGATPATTSKDVLAVLVTYDNVRAGRLLRESKSVEMRDWNGTEVDLLKFAAEESRTSVASIVRSGALREAQQLIGRAADRKAKGVDPAGKNDVAYRTAVGDLIAPSIDRGADLESIIADKVVTYSKLRKAAEVHGVPPSSNAAMRWLELHPDVVASVYAEKRREGR